MSGTKGYLETSPVACDGSLGRNALFGGVLCHFWGLARRDNYHFGDTSLREGAHNRTRKKIQKKRKNPLKKSWPLIPSMRTGQLLGRPPPTQVPRSGSCSWTTTASASATPGPARRRNAAWRGALRCVQGTVPEGPTRDTERGRGIRLAVVAYGLK